MRAQAKPYQSLARMREKRGQTAIELIKLITRRDARRLRARDEAVEEQSVDISWLAIVASTSSGMVLR
ncbi:MAG: hypothetical protein DI623_10300 [Sphingomonas sanxanigenens]|uniref:Uncharacterized protein n=1 Tax=Sphingomonas sanxanigenens TaxID=397260 RepID=A0A2W5C275_9SPHN|nr:MAG: hypothetical protein DI623_10300 [Sphingomonas sanxanigenens]